MNLKKVWFYPLLTLILLSRSYPLHSAPAYFINTRIHKYHLSQSTLTQYTNQGNRISSGECDIFSCPDGFNILDFAIADHSKTMVIGVLFTNETKTYLEIRDLAGTRLVIKDMTPYQPWKILFEDVDHDSNTEVCLGVYKKSPLHPIYAKRLFIYNFQKGLQPKWLGSRLARPFTDFNFIELNHQKTLIALELDSQGQTILNTYEWDCFGFTGIETGLNVTGGGGNADSLSTGYLLQNGQYQPVLFLLKHNSVIATIQLKMEE